jgi:hypothetical protein
MLERYGTPRRWECGLILQRFTPIVQDREEPDCCKRHDRRCQPSDHEHWARERQPARAAFVKVLVLGAF